MQWDTEVRPVLDAVHLATRNHPKPVYGVSQEDVNSELGRDPNDLDTALALDNLIRGGYLAEKMTGVDQQPGPGTVELTEKGFQVVAGWPSTTGEAMFLSILAEIDARIATAEPEEKSRLERFREFAVGIGRDVIVAVLTQQAQKVSP